MNIDVIAFTDRGRALSRSIAAQLPEEQVQLYAKAAGFQRYETVRSFAQYAMGHADAIVFVGATGIAVRAIAPFVQSKDTDPAVLVIDENGRFVISLLSGHIGGANRLVQRLALALGAVPVITTATDGRGIFAVDSWAAEHNCVVRNINAIKDISGALLRGEQVGLHSTFPVSGALPDGIATDLSLTYGVEISMDRRDDGPFAHTLYLTPRIVHVGLGCKRNTPPDALARWARQVLEREKIDIRAVASVASIDLKRDEAAVCRLAQAWHVPVQFYTAQELEQVQGDFSPSEFVRRVTGTDNVCQRAAAKASRGGRCLLQKTAQDGMTISLYCEDWRIVF
ncbi:MAG: cobalt-precorrin 5A hydrolase [Eubacteriales bacterium]|nr:cobalt-precorrin 5A hydrolase [Eubacteriales bacterium]